MYCWNNCLRCLIEYLNGIINSLYQKVNVKIYVLILQYLLVIILFHFDVNFILTFSVFYKAE